MEPEHTETLVCVFVCVCAARIKASCYGIVCLGFRSRYENSRHAKAVGITAGVSMKHVSFILKVFVCWIRGLIFTSCREFWFLREKRFRWKFPRLLVASAFARHSMQLFHLEAAVVALLPHVWSSSHISCCHSF